MQEKSKPFQLAVINDVHYCSSRPAAKSTLTNNVEMLNNSAVDAVINLGDNVMDAMQTDLDKLSKDCNEFEEIYSELKPRHFGAVGNHDYYSEKFNPADLEKIWDITNSKPEGLRYECLNESWDCIVLPSITVKADTVHGYDAVLTEEQFSLLEQILKANAELEEPAHILIASHVPILTVTPLMDRKHPMNRKSYEFPANHMHADSYRIVKLFESYPQVKLCISGHMHMVDHVQYQDVSYICCGSLCGMWWSVPVYKGHNAGNMFINLYDNGTFSHEYKEFPHTK